ncbi:MAG TPA: DUF1810 domain-containing protein [Burkholderiaceae bacterium]
MSDENDLQRFVDAQEPRFADAMAELSAGRKRTHWMWFVFPQLRGLGHSQMAWHYGIASREEAAAYLAHPVLGPRLRDGVERLLAVRGRTAHEIFGSPDDLKLLSCLTLFAEVEQGKGNGVFDRALRQYYAGQPDAATLELLAKSR